MSDANKYSDIEAEILLTIGTPTDVKTVASTCSVEDLCIRDGIRKPAIGVMNAGMRRQDQVAVGRAQFLATTTWAIIVAVDNLRGAVSGRSTVYGILESVRDRLHYKRSSYAPGRYMAISEEWPEQQPEGLIVCASLYEIQMLLGQNDNA